MHILLKTGFCFLLIWFSTLALAQTASESPAEKQSAETVSADAPQTESEPKQYYIVEVILFRHLNQEGKLDEFWYHPALTEDADYFMAKPLLQDDRLTQLSDDNPALAEYDMTSKRFLALRNGIAALNSSNYKLADSAAHLRYSPDYRVLAHFGWTQLALSKQHALPILIKSDQFSDPMTPSGELKLHVSRYLHMQVDLSATTCELPENLTSIDAANETQDDQALDEKLEQGSSTLEQPQLAGTNPEPAAISQCIDHNYRFQQQRKMRSKELHYLDNPVYGLLVYITPFTAEE